MATRCDYTRADADSPFALAYRMAGYMKDATYIANYVAREYGAHRAPSAAQVADMQVRHAQAREKFASQGHVRSGSYNPDNDNGLPYKPGAKPHGLTGRKPRLAKVELVKPAPAPEAEPEPLPVATGLPHERIINSVAKAFGIAPADIRGRRRLAQIVAARGVAIKLLREVTYSNGRPRYSYPIIGRMMGRDHSTIIHAFDTFDDRARKFPAMIEAYEALRG